MMDEYQVMRFCRKVFKYFNGKVNKHVLASLQFNPRPNNINAVTECFDIVNIDPKLLMTRYNNASRNNRIRSNTVILIIGALAEIEYCKIDTLYGIPVIPMHHTMAIAGYTANYLNNNLDDIEEALHVKACHSAFKSFIRNNISKYEKPCDENAIYYNTNVMNYVWYIMNQLSKLDVRVEDAPLTEDGNLDRIKSYEFFKYVWCNTESTVDLEFYCIGQKKLNLIRLKNGTNEITLKGVMSWLDDVFVLKEDKSNIKCVTTNFFNMSEEDGCGAYKFSCIYL